MVFRSNGKQFAGPTQLLPCGNVTEDQAKEALQAFSNAVKLMYTSSGSVPELPQKSFAWKHFRVPTKNLLMAFSNALVQSMPPGWNLQKAVPSRLLAPRGSQADRFVLQKCEKESLGLPEWTQEAKLHFIYDFANQTRLLDFQDDSSHFKLCFAADEGTEASSDLLKLTLAMCVFCFQANGLCLLKLRGDACLCLRGLQKLFHMYATRKNVYG